MFIIFTAIVLMAVFIGWSIGANDAANNVGAGVGSGEISLREGIIICCFFGFLGAMLIGNHVIYTIGNGIVPMNLMNQRTAIIIALTACFGAGIWVVLATMAKIPVSTSHAIVGSVGGAGLAIGVPIFWNKLGSIFACWIFTPIGAALLAYLIYQPIQALYYRFTPDCWRSKVLRWLIIITSAYSAFSWGGNDVANASGLLMGAKMATPFVAALIGAGAIVLGITTMGYKVIETVGYRITRLLPMMAIVAQVASALNVYIYTIFGIPVSTSHSIVGAVAGVGLVTGKTIFDSKLARDIVFAWAITPFAAGILSYFMVFLIVVFFGL